MKRIAIAAAALVTSGGAWAADLPVKAVPAAAVFSWTGCYVGAVGGYQHGQSQQKYGGRVNGTPNAFLPTGFDMSGKYYVRGANLGATAGCNYQTGRWVFGVEGDAWWAGSQEVGATGPTPGAVALGLNTNFRFTTNQKWMTTARLRAGYAVDRWMWYATAGVAYSQFTVNNFNGTGVITAQRIPTDVDRLGWVAGVGTEYAIVGNWSLKAEYLFAHFGKFRYGDEPGVLNDCTAGCANADVKMYEHIVRVGINYRFGAPVLGLGATEPVRRGMPVKAPVLPPVVASWSGFYIGGAIGASWQDQTATWVNSGGLSFTHDRPVAAGSLFAGVQWQFNNIVFGVEANRLLNFRSLDLANGDSGLAHGLTTGTPNQGCPLATQLCQGGVRDVWTYGARLGWVPGVNNWLLYGTGGLAVGEVVSIRRNINTVAGPLLGKPSFIVDNLSDKRTGWFAGGGVEYALVRSANWDVIAGADYKHIDLGTVNLTGATAATRRDVQTTVDILTARLSVKLNWAAIAGGAN